MAVSIATAVAKPVSPGLASDVASAFFPNVDMTIAEIGNIYIFSPVDGNGFVLVAADDCSRPVLAWSLSSRFPVDNMPAHVRSWLEGYSREIGAFAALGVQSHMVAAEWDMFLNGRPKSGIAVDPMLTTVWGQGYPFNALCPYDWDVSAYSVTGCTATATAQIMKYWNHPEVGWGNHSYYHPSYGLLSAQFDTTHYRWTQMPDTLNDLSSDEAKSAVAELMYHVGVAVEMNYSPSGSGAATNSYGYLTYPSAENALKSYFRYNPLLHSVYKSEHTDMEWDGMLRGEIDASRPVLYAGYDEAGGHAFVLDGYDSLGMFHVNWGWGGSYDGYYTIDSLSPGAGGIGGNATYTFNMNNSAVIGIMPVAIDTDSVSVINVVSATPNMGSVVGSGTYNNHTQVDIIARAHAGCRFSHWTSGNMANPLSFLANGDITDTAVFERIGGDTLGYCTDALRSAWRDDYGDITEWGIRLPVAMRTPGRNLTAVQLYVYESNNEYIINIYRGDSICDATLAYTRQFIPEWTGWHTVVLDSAVRVDNYKPLWVTVRYQGDGYPAANSRYSGNSDGSWYRLPDGWHTYDNCEGIDSAYSNVYLTWMLRAILEAYPIMIEVAPADENICTVYGGGQYMGGDEVTVGAVILDPRCHFTHWSDGTLSNPFTFTAMDNILLIAHCQCNGIGIEEIEPSKLQVATSGHDITIVNPHGATVGIYDIQGRRLTTLHSPLSTLKLPAAGVYFLRADGQTTKIVIK